MGNPLLDPYSIYTYHPRVRVLGTVAKCGSQGAGAALVVMGVLAVVDGTVDTDGPHTRGVSVTVTVVLLSAVPGRPDVDIAQSVSALKGIREQTSDMNGRKQRDLLFSKYTQVMRPIFEQTIK